MGMFRPECKLPDPKVLLQMVPNENGKGIDARRLAGIWKTCDCNVRKVVKNFIAAGYMEAVPHDTSNMRKPYRDRRQPQTWRKTGKKFIQGTPKDVHNFIKNLETASGSTIQKYMGFTYEEWREVRAKMTSEGIIESNEDRYWRLVEEE